MQNLSLKYNQDFKKADLVEDIFEDVEVSNKGDSNILSLNNRNGDSKISDDKKIKINKKGYLLLSLFFGLIILFVIFVVLILSSQNKISLLDFQCFMKV